jgi:hypothetical protein
MSAGCSAIRAQGVHSHFFNITRLVAVRYVFWAGAAFVVPPGVSIVITALDQTVARGFWAILIRRPGVTVTAVFRTTTAVFIWGICFPRAALY